MFSIGKCLRKAGAQFCFLILVLALSLGHIAAAEAKAKTKAKKTKARPKIVRTLPAAPAGDKYADLIIEAQTGRVLRATNSAQLRHPASLTKMMTLYLAFQALESGALRMDTPLPVSALAAGQSPSKLGLRAGQTIRAQDAIMGLITESANDASVVLAEALGGDVKSFAEMMNRQARALGMNSTHFENPNGLPDPQQVTTARDMASLGYGLIYHFPGFYPYFSRESFVYNGRTHRNHNRLMSRYDGMDGIKTGYIRASGFNLVASAARGDTRLIGVVFGGRSAPSRDKQMEALLNEGFASARRASDVRAEGGDYLPLPSKVATAFSSRGVQRAARRETEERIVVPVTSAGTAEEVGGGWGIQVGAFSEVEGAQAALASMARRLSPLLDAADQSLQKITMTDGSAMYRARFLRLDERTARAACSHLVRQGQSCLVVTGP